VKGTGIKWYEKLLFLLLDCAWICLRLGKLCFIHQVLRSKLAFTVHTTWSYYAHLLFFFLLVLLLLLIIDIGISRDDNGYLWTSDSVISVSVPLDKYDIRDRSVSVRISAKWIINRYWGIRGY
jgi:hypothetical protein